MSMKPLNVWRVYLDLFMNLTGVIALGGAGMMILVGGATLGATPGPAGYATPCEGWDRVSHHRGISTATRREFADPAGCTLDIHYPALTFASDQYDADGLDRNAVKALCDDLEMVLWQVRYVTDANVEVVGRTSEKFDAPRTCKSERTLGNEARRRVVNGYAGEPFRRDSDGEERSRMDRHLCNGELGARRALAVLNRCLTYVQSEGEETSKLILERVRVSTPSRIERDRLGAMYRESDRNRASQTVTLRIQMPVIAFNEPATP